MNGGNTPGHLLAQIESALCSAFPSEMKLAMMLRHQFSQNLAQVASGGNLKEIVYNLVQDFQTRNSLENLLDGALNENPRNSELKKLYSQEFKIPPSLLTILFPLPNNIIEPIQQAYKACCPNHFDDWEDEPLESLAKILENLHEIAQGTDNEKPIVQFVDRLLETGDIPEPTAEKLKQWLEKNANNPSDLLSQSSSDSQNYQQPNLDAQPYLLIKLDSSKQYCQQRQKRYLVSAWAIYEKINDNYSRDKPFKKLEHCREYDKNYGKNVISIKNDLPTLIKDFLNQLTRSNYPKKIPKPIIVFLVNRQLLKYKFDIIKIQDKYDEPIVIGSEYCVVIRSIKRLEMLKDYPGYQQEWEKKWKTLKESCEVCCHAQFCDISNFNDSRKLTHFLSWPPRENNIPRYEIALKLYKPPSNKIYGVIEGKGIPVALWLRKNNCETKNDQDELDKLLNCKINELPEKVIEKRSEACSNAKNKQEYIGHHLTLLWEDPYLIPTQVIDDIIDNINYTTP
ncbi:effector-associated domain EAD1-containing protein [Moorena sp. SIO3I6]|uniref:VMAP-C domain-containing protein n=1 Tax=Moorena sp. SIO3I6 TaxID=2607831 RepID=UPI0013F7E703|nr:effector-associated domain EAD1-containing protein [Moorena sp. SIO3I6]NEP20620.1 hypothetical protein [Moorena sp. SIO3I6]